MPSSKIVIGCMSWGKWGKQFSIQEQIDLIDFCIDNGNTTFDHADLYGDYTTEAEFGNALKKANIKRDKIQLITKCGIQNPGVTRNNTVKHYDYSKNYIIWSAEQSLKNLQTDYLDTFLLHRPSPLMHPDEIAEAISKLKKEGKIKKFGVSNFTPSQIDLVQSQIKVEVNQIQFSLTENSVMANGSLDQMIEENIQPMCWSPLGSVFKETNDKTIRIREVLKTLSSKYNAKEDTLLLSWILKHPSKIAPVIGTTNKTRILNANKALELNLELEDWFLLLEAAKGKEVD